MTAFRATEENVKLIGRYIIKDGITWLVQSGSSAEFSVTGRSAEIVIAGDRSIYADPEYRPRYGVFVDNVLMTDRISDKPQETIKLFCGDGTVTKTVRVMMLSEAECGAVGVKSISVESNEKTPLVPAPKKDICIEFIGDSITCAYGVEGKNENEPFSTSTENFTKSYAYLTAQKLNADYSAVCYSGHGIISGYTTGGKDTAKLVPPLYDTASKFPEHTEKWEHDRHRYDIVVINLGTNDSSYIAAYEGAYFDERMSEFTAGYIAFLRDIRAINKDSYIVCTIGTMDKFEIHDHVEKAVEDYKKVTGDSRIIFIGTPLQDERDGYGCDFHPSKVTQTKLAEMLAKEISGLLTVV